MKKAWYTMLAKVTGRNSQATPPDVITAQLNEKRPLPIGMTEFETWSDRIISGTMLPDNMQMKDSQKFALADMLLHLGPTVDSECDAYFIKSLRKYAVNQIADAKRKALYEAAKQRLADEKAAQAELDKTVETVSEDHA